MAKQPLEVPAGWTPPPPRGVHIMTPEERAGFDRGYTSGKEVGAMKATAFWFFTAAAFCLGRWLAG